MVNKPAALYLEDAINARCVANNTAIDDHIEYLDSPLSRNHGSLHPVAMIRAPGHGSGTGSSSAISNMRAGAQLSSLIRARQVSSLASSHLHVPERLAQTTLQSNETAQHRTINQPRSARESLQRITSHAPEVLYAQLDSGFVFECFVSQRGKRLEVQYLTPLIRR
jgi:hypothetical protein